MTTRRRGLLGVSLIMALPLTAACIEDGPTTRPADRDEIREMTEAWTGVALPEDLELITGSYVSAFMDPSLSAVFDAKSVEVDGFVDALGPRQVRRYAADCTAPLGSVLFAEVPGSGRELDQGIEPVVLTDELGTLVAADLARLVSAGTLERCRNVARAYARPRGTVVTVTQQPRAGGVSRVVLSVVTM